MHTRLNIAASKADLAAELSSCSLLWHWCMTVLSLLSIMRLEIQLLPSKDLQLEESLRKQGRSKGGYFDWPFPAPTLCARNSNVAIAALLLTSDLSTPHSPWASRGGGEKSSNATKENVPTPSYSLLLRSSPTLWCKPGGWWVYVEHLHSFSTPFFTRLCPPPGAKGPYKPRAGCSQQAELPLELQICQ